jgi:two-component system alkaline phosphatase synthesis response regulator PhoP
LLARINTIIRRTTDKNKEKNDNILTCFDIEIDTFKKIVKKSGEIITLTSNEYDILKKLVQENGKIVPREVIMKDII